MKHAFVTRCLAVAAAALAIAGCTMKEQEPPALNGPSEFAQSITISITPDVIQQDGSSQSLITVTARGINGAPLANLPLRADVRVGGVVTDFGSISARNLVTNAEGRATVVYTAPPAIAGLTESTLVDIGITPLGNDFGNSTTRLASLRLVPPGTVVPPASLVVSITVEPETPTDNDTVVLRASVCAPPTSADPCPAPSNSIVSYAWNFGDGTAGTGQTTTHTFTRSGTFAVQVTVTDAIGRTATGSRSVTVSPGVGPTARFTTSPGAPVVNQSVNFNAATSTPAAGRRIVSYVWDFGDGTPQASGLTTSHAYGRAGSYVVTLTVTDDVGRTNSTTGQVTVSP